MGPKKDSNQKMASNLPFKKASVLSDALFWEVFFPRPFQGLNFVTYIWAISSGHLEEAGGQSLT